MLYEQQFNHFRTSSTGCIITAVASHIKTSGAKIDNMARNSGQAGLTGLGHPKPENTSQPRHDPKIPYMSLFTARTETVLKLV